MAAGMPANDKQPNQYRADQHNDSYVEAGVKRLITGGSTKKAGRGADRAESEIEFFHPSAGNDQEPQENRGKHGKDSAEDPRAGMNPRGQPDTRGRIGRKHLPYRYEEEHDRMHQSHDRALAVGEYRESAHSIVTILYPKRRTRGCDPDHALRAPRDAFQPVSLALSGHAFP